MVEFAAFASKVGDATLATHFAKSANPVSGMLIDQCVADIGEPEITMRDLMMLLKEEGDDAAAAGVYAAFVQWLWERRTWVQTSVQ